MLPDNRICSLMPADHAAVAIANARAFEEIARLKQQLELENEYLRDEVRHRFGDLVGPSAPLRERVVDVPLPAARCLNKLASRMGFREFKLKRRHALALRNCAWPGNVRELQHVIDRAVMIARTGEPRFDLPGARETGADPPRVTSPLSTHKILSYEDLTQREVENLHAALEAANWKMSGPGGAAELLGVKATKLASRIKAMGLTRPMYFRPGRPRMRIDPR